MVSGACNQQRPLNQQWYIDIISQVKIIKSYHRHLSYRIIYIISAARKFQAAARYIGFHNTVSLQFASIAFYVELESCPPIQIETPL